MYITSTSVIKRLIILFLVIAGIYFAKSFLMPLAIATLLATLFFPFCKWLENNRVPKIISPFICLLLLIAAFAGIGALLGWQVSELTNDVALVKQAATETVYRIQQYILIYLGIPPEKQSEILRDQQTEVIGILKTVAGSVFSILTNIILVLVYMFLFLYYRVHLRQFFLKLSPAEQQPELEQVIYSAAHVSQQYLLGLLKMIACLWIMYFTGFSIVGVPNAAFFAILCGLLEIVPYIGNLTGTVLTVVVSAVHGGSAGMLAGIVITYGIIQFIQGWFLEAVIVGPQVRINPFSTILALVLGELLWGIPGVILAIPITAMVKILCDHIEPLQPYGFLIGEVKGKDIKEKFEKKVKGLFKKM